MVFGLHGSPGSNLIALARHSNISDGTQSLSSIKAIGKGEVEYHRNCESIFAAAENNNGSEILRFVVEMGVDPNIVRKNDNRSALQIAAIEGKAEAIQTLIDCSANVNVVNSNNGGSLLHCVVKFREPVDERVECLRILLQAGVDATKEDKYGETPADQLDKEDDDDAKMLSILVPYMTSTASKLANLLILIKQHEADGVRIFFDNNQNEHMLTSEIDPQSEQNAMEYFADCFVEWIESDESHNEDAKKIGENYVDILRLLIEDGSDIKSGSSVLNKICSTFISTSDDIKLDLLQVSAKLLLQCGTELTDDTIHLLHSAARRNNIKFISFAIDTLQISPNTKGRQGMRPLHFACRSGRAECARLLLEKGADLNLTDDLGKTPIDVAIINEKKDIVLLLESYRKGKEE